MKGDEEEAAKGMEKGGRKVGRDQGRGRFREEGDKYVRYFPGTEEEEYQE